VSYDPKFPLKAYDYKGYRISTHGDIWGAFKDGKLIVTGQNPLNCEYELNRKLDK
jgi:hypothetical protein